MLVLGCICYFCEQNEYDIQFDFMSKLLRVGNSIAPSISSKSQLSKSGKAKSKISPTLTDDDSSGEEEDAFVRSEAFVKNDFAVDKGLFQRKLSRFRKKMFKSNDAIKSAVVVPMDNTNVNNINQATRNGDEGSAEVF